MADPGKTPPKKGIKERITTSALRVKIKQSFAERLRALRAAEQDRNRNLVETQEQLNCQQQLQAMQSDIRNDLMDTSPVAVTPEQIDVLMVQVIEEVTSFIGTQQQSADPEEHVRRLLEGIVYIPNVCNICNVPLDRGYLCDECSETMNLFSNN